VLRARRQGNNRWGFLAGNLVLVIRAGVEVLGLGKKSPSWCIVVLQERLVDKVPRHDHYDKKVVRIPLGDETLTIRSNRSDGYASIVSSEQRAELFDRIGMLERDNLRLKGMLDVERQ
ncbi:hypothetical protein Tco_1199440, partial [Tanacetum coccineum]